MKYIRDYKSFKKNKIINFVIFIFSIYLGLLIVEFFIHFYLDKRQIQNTFPTIYEYLINKDLSKYQPYNLPQELTVDKKKIYTLGSTSSKKIVVCNENNYMSIFTSDKYGFNNQNYDWNNDIFLENVLLIGDSFILGACVHQDKNIGSLIKNKANKKILSLANNGAGPLVKLAMLREYANDINIDKIFWFYYEGNDFSDFEKELKVEILRKYLNDENFSQGLKYKQEKINNIFENKNLVFIRSPGNDIYNRFQLIKLKNIILKIKTFYFNINDRKLEEYLKVIKSIKKFTQSKNIDFYFVYLPDFNRYKENKFKDLYNKKKLISSLKSNNINIIDIDKKVFSLDKDPISNFPNKQFGHYNEMGYRKISNLILEYVR